MQNHWGFVGFSEVFWSFLGCSNIFSHFVCNPKWTDFSYVFQNVKLVCR